MIATEHRHQRRRFPQGAIFPRRFLLADAWRKIGWLCLVVAVGLSCSASVYADLVPLMQKPWALLSDQQVNRDGRAALGIRPAAWLHGESPHFILHYRRITEAKKVALEIEYHLAFVARTLGATPERYARKSHVFIFEDENDWKTFLKGSALPPWFASFAVGDELFLNVRDARTGIFDSQTLAHETTHAVVARLYPGKRWPVWLSEGFAEQMSGLSVSARLGQYNPRLGLRSDLPNLSVAQMTSLGDYPNDVREVAQLYQSSERLVRFLMAGQGPERFPRLVDLILNGETLETAVPKVYPERYPNYATFLRRYEQLK